VDGLLFLAAVGCWLLVIGGQLASSTPPVPTWLFSADVIAGALGCAGLWLRRRWPVGLALVLIALSTFSETVAGAMVVTLFTVAVHRPPQTTARVYALSLLAALVYVVLRPEPGTPRLLLFLLGVVVQSAAVGWGLFIHYRRQLVMSLRDRAVRAETEAQLRAEQAQRRARDEIAREMHDVLGHRLSLLSVHAGALEFRPDAPAEEIAGAAKVIRENAHQALQDLREVIGVLRAPVGELPQPTLADVAQLVAESGRAGMRVDLRRGRRRRSRPGRPHRLPGRAGGPDQRPQARPGGRGPGPPVRSPRPGPDRRGPERAPRPAPPPDLAPPPGGASPVAVGPGPTGAMHPDPLLAGPPVGERSPTAGSVPGLSTAPGLRSPPGRGWWGWPSGSRWPADGWSTGPPPLAAGGWWHGYPGRHERIRAPEPPGGDA
jgi:hypothetical protein